VGGGLKIGNRTEMNGTDSVEGRVITCGWRAVWYTCVFWPETAAENLELVTHPPSERRQGKLFNVFQAARKRKIEEKEIYYVRYKVIYIVIGGSLTSKYIIRIYT